ncbi:transposase [Streptomyces sp. NPDC006332]|uniref:transposase n=1 Tax=Streptomyces sp. NPDC006332 TaxID=3155456 RepID=UPI0033A6E79A
MPKPYPEEFRQDVVRVARNRGPGVTVEQVATDFQVHPMTLWKWMRRADIDDGSKPGVTSQESAELREARRQAAGAGERGPAPGRGLSVAGASAGKWISQLVKELAVDGVPLTVTCRVLKLARQPYYRWLGKPVADAVLEEAYRANALFDAHRDDPEFGYRFLADEARGAGAGMAERTAWRICRDNRWWSVLVYGLALRCRT